MVLFSEDHIQETNRRGRIEVICGSMFSGKTEELIRRLTRMQEMGADVATCPLSAIKGLLNHPLTDSGLKKFLEDYKKVNG